MIKNRTWIKRAVALVFIAAGTSLIAGAQVSPTTFLKIKHDPGKTVINDQAGFAAVRTMQEQVVARVGGNPAVSMKHPPHGIACFACHDGVPKGVFHTGVALNEANPATSCGMCHVNNLYSKLAGLPYFTEIKFALTDAASVMDAEARVDNAIMADSMLTYTGVVKNDSDVKWEFEVQRLPQERGAFPMSYNTLIDKTAVALETLKNHRLTTPAVSPEVQVKVEVKASDVVQLQVYPPEFGTLDMSILAAIRTATVTRTVEAKWSNPALPYSSAYGYIRDTITAQFGEPKTVKPEEITWEIGGGATIVAKFSSVDNNYSKETKITFSKIAVEIEDEALTVLKSISNQFPSVVMAEAKLVHQYAVKNGTTEMNAQLINALQAYTTTGALPDREFKYEVLVKNGTDVFSNMIAFFDQKRADYAGSLVKTKTELKWRPSAPTINQYKVEVVAADRN